MGIFDLIHLSILYLVRISLFSFSSRKLFLIYFHSNHRKTIISLIPICGSRVLINLVGGIFGKKFRIPVLSEDFRIGNFRFHFHGLFPGRQR